MSLIKRSRTVVIFGASGFLGRYIVNELLKNNWIIKIFVRNPNKARHLTLMGKVGQVSIHQCDIMDSNKVQKSIINASKVINLVGILEENNKQNFKNIHLIGATNIAKGCLKNNVDSYIHFSALGLFDGEHSKYAKSKLDAENKIKKIFKNTIIFKPSVVFGPEDQFTNKFAKMACVSLFLPLINSGKTKFQPVYVKDISTAVGIVINNNIHNGKTYNLGGPEIMSFKEILDLILFKIKKKRIYLNLSFPMAKLISLVFSISPVKPITLDQVRLLEKDNILPKNGLSFKDLGIRPSSLISISDHYLKRYISKY